MKIVLEVKGNTPPKANDILVYDKTSEGWKICPKKAFLKEVYDSIKEVQKTCEITQKKCQEAQEDVKSIAKIIKDGIK